ncbi:MAG: DEAD/DEAH box helicase [Muribaculaceae bacterium]|nr:DEAD/DEAH box helicase [Muribaculaceae bacterium]
MAEKFGKTWWGNAWLQSLSHIDYSNRIPRGARYARNGSAREITVKKNVITARVQGTRRTPYKETIVIPEFTEAEKKRLIDALVECPGIISDLLDRKLDAEVLNIARKCGVKIFPARWDDLRMSCSCPDWAVPCKHLAAVVYMMSKEIDNNPFLVFEMHGLDIIGELEKRGIHAGKAKETTEVPLLEDLVGLQPKPAKVTVAEPFKRIDFSHLEDRTDILLRLLPSSPSFSTHGNFKQVYASTVAKAQKKLARLMAGTLPAEEVFAGDEGDFELTLDSEMPVEMNNLHLDSYAIALLGMNADFLPDYNRSVIANHQALHAAMHLLRIGSIAPRITKTANDFCGIFWFPAEIDVQAKRIVEQLAEIVPPDMIFISDKKKKLYPQHPASMLIEMYLDLLMERLTAGFDDDDIEFIFFNRRTIKFNAIGQKETPGAIKSWCDHLQIAQARWQPVFNVTEDEDTERFLLTLAVADREHPAKLPIALGDILRLKKYEGTRFEMLRSFSLLSVLLPDISAYINSGAKQPIEYTYKSFVPFLFEVIPTVQMLDIKVFMPKSLAVLLRPKPTIRVSIKDDGKSMFGLSDLLDFSWEVAVGENVLTLDEFRRLMTRSDALLKFKGQFVYVSADDMKRLHDAITKGDRLSDGRLLQAVLAGEYETAPLLLTDEVKELIKELTKQETIPPPASLQATLRPYQERGYSWLYRNMRIGFGSILADDMGLGKTLQTISLLLKLKEDYAFDGKRALIVAPTGLLTNWQAEISRFAPQLSCEVYHGNARSLKDFSSDILLTTYGMVRTDAAKLKKLPWRVMVIDEAQNIKNRDTQQTKAISSIAADTHIALSGTPVENRLSEFWSIMNFANKGYLDTIKDFNERFAKPIQQNGDEVCAERFRRVTAPFMMRRMKTDKAIISDLPDKIEMNDFVSLYPEQAALYQSTLQEAMAVIEGMNTDDSKELFKRQGLILQMILALKQICNHPAQYLKNGDLRAELSGKTEMLLDSVQSIMDAGEKVLVFTQFKEMGDMLVRFIAERTGREPLFYHGGCSVKQRSEMVARFQNGKQDKVFVLSLKAAGTGLNLTAASHVIHYDLWWNPAVEAQATDRAYRIGQNKNVMVHRFITKGTFEEKIDRMIQEKKHLADMTVASGESWIGKLSNKELRDLFE